jgi:hypothetical protein
MKRLLAAFAITLAPSLAHAQAFQANFSTAAVAPTMATSAHSSGQALGGWSTVTFFSSSSTPTAFLGGLTLVSAGGAGTGGTTQPVAFYVYTKNVTGTSTCTDGQAFAEADADAKFRAVTPFLITPAAIAGSTTTGGTQPLAISVVNEDSPSATDKLYVCMVAGGSITPGHATTDLSFKLWGVRD